MTSDKRYVILDAQTGLVAGPPANPYFPSQAHAEACVKLVMLFAAWAGTGWQYVVAEEIEDGVYLALKEPA